MKRYCLIDTVGTGHHWIYDKQVIEALMTEPCQITYKIGYHCSDEQRACLESLGCTVSEFDYDVKGFRKRWQLLRYHMDLLRDILDECERCRMDKVVFLYADAMYAALFYAGLRKYSFKIDLIVHWFPGNTFDSTLFRLAAADQVIVHTKYIKQKMPKRLRHKTKCVNYPMVDASPALNGASTRGDTVRKTLLYFGGTRYDKGLDILLKALAKITVDCDLIIAGSENYFKEAYIREALQACPHVKNAEIMLRFVSDEEMDACYCQADIVVIPYRKNFRGESGVLLDAICHEKIIVAADIMHFKEYIDEAKSGIVFEAENIDDLTENLEMAISDYLKLKSGQDCEEFKKMHTSENFKRELHEIIAITG